MSYQTASHAPGQGGTAAISTLQVKSISIHHWLGANHDGDVVRCIATRI